MDLADGLETGSPYFHLHSPDLALSLHRSLRCSSSPLSESALICSSFLNKEIYICFIPSGSRVAKANRVPAPHSRNVTFRTSQNKIRSQSGAPGLKTDLQTIILTG